LSDSEICTSGNRKRVMLHNESTSATISETS
jgi:hypothetical protein